MKAQDITQIINNGFLTIQNFFRAIFILATGRGREPSRVEDETSDGLNKNEQSQGKEVSATDVVEAELKKIQAAVQSAKSKCSDYLKKPREDQLDFVFLELLLNLQEAVKNAIQSCRNLQGSNNIDMVSEKLSEFETSDVEIAQIINKVIPKARISVLEYTSDLFALENVEQALAEASEKNPNYIEIFDTISDHLLPEDGMDEEEWLQKFGYYVDKLFNSDFREYDKRVKTSIGQSHFIKTITRTDISVNSRQALIKLLEAFNSILRIYALDERYKEVEISIQPLEVHEPVQSTIQELHEDMSAWFSSYRGTVQNSKRAIKDESDLKQKVKPKKVVRFAKENQTRTITVNEDDYDEILGSRDDVERLKKGGRIPGAIERSINKKIPSLEEKLQKLRSHKPKRRARRASTFGGPAKPPKPRHMKPL